MSLESTAATAGALWLWEQYGKALSDKALGGVRDQWAKFRWKEAELKYRARLQEQHNTIRLLGHPKPISIEDLYIDTYVLDKPTAFWRYDIKELQHLPFGHGELSLELSRKPAIQLMTSAKRLYILGKPGSGKTTYLKFMILLACKIKNSKTPIYVSLKEWDGTGLDLMPFLVKQFEICAFPNAQEFIEHLLLKGESLVLFDGLDEVNQEGDKRSRMIRTLTGFAKRYPQTQLCITCRIAATDYSFEQFTYIEIADFNKEQIHQFANRWYQDDQLRLAHFVNEFDKPEHVGLRDLAKTPLLLALLCLVFDELGYFPRRRVDLYKEAIDALLKKWDSSRNINRDGIYRNLSLGRKEQMLARVAAENFDSGVYFVSEESLIGQISSYLKQLPSADLNGEFDPETILKAIEMQHGILVERAHQIYSFSHLTFQEYFTARYIVDNAAGNTVKRLVQYHFNDSRWQEVILLTASMLDNADPFFESFLDATSGLIRDNKLIVNLLQQVAGLVRPNDSHKSSSRAFLLAIALIVMLTRAINPLPLDAAFDLVQALDDKHIYIPILDRAASLSISGISELVEKGTLADYLGIKFNIATLGIDNNLSRAHVDEATFLEEYLGANLLLLECLDIATATNRTEIKERLLLPPLTGVTPNRLF